MEHKVNEFSSKDLARWVTAAEEAHTSEKPKVGFAFLDPQTPCCPTRWGKGYAIRYIPYANPLNVGIIRNGEQQELFLHASSGKILIRHLENLLLIAEHSLELESQAKLEADNAGS